MNISHHARLSKVLQQWFSGCAESLTDRKFNSTFNSISRLSNTLSKWASKSLWIIGHLTSNIVAEIDDKHTIQRRVSSKLHHLYFRESGTLFNCILQWLARVPCLVVFKPTELVAFAKLTLAWDAEVLATILAQAGYLLVEGVTEVLTIHPVEK